MSSLCAAAYQHYTEHCARLGRLPHAAFETVLNAMVSAEGTAPFDKLDAGDAGWDCL
jgi:hypothetical protein